MRIIWKILLTMAVAIIIIIISIAMALPRLIDANSHQKYIQSFIQSATGKDVEMGMLGISLWKGIELYATDVQIKEKKESHMQPILKAEKISAKIALWPLLRKKIRLNNIRVHSPEINYLVGGENPFGSFLLLTQIESLVEKAAPDFSSGEDAAQDESSFFSDFLFDPSGLERIEIKKGIIEMQKSLQSGEMLSLSLDKVSMDLVRSPSPSSFSFDARASFREGGGQLKIQGALEQPEGKEQIPLHIVLTAHILKSQIFSKQLQSMTGIGIAEGRINLNAEIDGILGGNINMRGDGEFENLSLKGSTPEAFRGKPLKGIFSFNGQMGKSVIKIDEANIQIGQSIISMKGTIDLKEAKPTLQFSLQGKAINSSDLKDIWLLLPYQLPADVEGGTLQASVRGKAQMGSFQIQDISGKAVLDDFTITADSLPGAIQNIGCQVEISKNALDISALNAQFLDSPIQGNMHVDMLATPVSTFDLNMLGGRAKGHLAFPGSGKKHYLLEMEIARVDTNSFLSMLSPAHRNIIHGQSAGKMQLKSKELISEDIFQQIVGGGDFKIENGRITTFGFLKQVGAILHLLGGKGIGDEETPFELLEGRFHLSKGDCEINNLFLKSPDFSLKGEGKLRFDSSLDFSFQANFSKEVSQAMVTSTPFLQYRMDSRGELSFPLRISGNINHPEVVLDLDKILKRSTKEKLLNKIKDFLNK